MRTEKILGVIIRRSSRGEADQLLTLLTQKGAKVKLLAKGVRRIKSRRGPHLELFNQVELVVHRGTNFASITEVIVRQDWRDLKSDLRLSGYLFYLAEVLDKILPESEPHPEIFSLYLRTVDSLTITNAQERAKQFVVQLLWNLGYLPKNQYPKDGVTAFVETIVERKIRSKKFLEEI